MSEINQKTLETITINDFNQICRLCPSKKNLTELYKNLEIINMLQSYSQLQFDENDGLPDKICENCARKTTETYNFLNTCKIIDATYRKCLTNPEIKVETIFLETNIKEEEDYVDADGEVEIKQETETDDEVAMETEKTIDYRTVEHQYHQNQNTLLDFVRLGKEYGCDSLIMRYFSEPSGAERLSMHFFMTSFVAAVNNATATAAQTSDAFRAYCSREMTDELCASAAAAATLRQNAELRLELRYGRITSSKMHAVSCCCGEAVDEYFIENVVGFYKINETAKRAKTTTELMVQKIEKQLNVKIEKRGLTLSGKWPEFAAKLDGVTGDAVIKIKYPKNHKDCAKYVDADKNLTPKTKTEMHLLMLMAGLRTSYLCIIDPSFANTTTIIRVDFNERYFAEILRKCQMFWAANIFPCLVKTVSQT